MTNTNKIFLIIDDDAEDREFFCEAVSEIDPSYICYEAHNAEDALSLLCSMDSSRLPDYIFLDLNMPRMNGRECLQELKNNEGLQHIPVIIYTTSSSKADFEETKKLGAASFITKPSTFSAICTSIIRIVNQF